MSAYDVYKFPTFAGWLLGHKANTNKIHAKDGYMATLRYNINLQTNAFVHKNNDTAESAYADARRLKDNPY
ncbi:hypothetical protein PGTUg99_034674, partial [Puccinia graminis f. sp. tritici]